MKVSHWTTRVLQTPADNPLVVGVPQPGTREFVTLELDTDEGIQGIGVTFFGGPLTPALRAAVDNLCELTVGQDPMQVEAVAESLKQAAGSAGPEGIFTLALSAIDMALWDIKGKALGQTVCALLGGCPGPGEHLRQRRADAALQRGVSGRGWAPLGVDGFQPDEDPDGRRTHGAARRGPHPHPARRHRSRR